MVLFCFGQGWGLFGWFSLLFLVCLCGKVGLTLSSQAFVHRIVIGYKMRSSMNDKPVLPKTGVGGKKRERERKNQEKEEASSRMLPPRCWHLNHASHGQTGDICSPALLYAISFSHTHKIHSHTLLCIPGDWLWLRILTVSLPSVFLVSADLSKGAHQPGIEVMW